MRFADWGPVLAGIGLLFLLAISQRYWFLQAWGLGDRVERPALRYAIRFAAVFVFGLLVVGLLLDFAPWRPGIRWRSSRATALAGLWLTSALFSYLALHVVTAIDWVWSRARPAPPRAKAETPCDEGASSDPQLQPVNLARRRFVQGATILAGAVPFAAAAYGFGVERLRFQVHTVELPISGLPGALEGMRIAQLSDLHMSSYFSAADARRAVDMANEFNADVVMVTGDFITTAADPLELCIAELSRLHAPLGVWGCNGNHEIYAGVEALAGRLFERYGMRMLRQENVELVHHGQPFNLIGVDYQRTDYRRPSEMLRKIEPLVQRDMPNILLSHNPNAFPRAAELGIELMLAGHTHGGQVRVEILNHTLSPALFFTRYVADLYRRPLGATSTLSDEAAWAGAPGKPAAVVYVNRGLGTIGAPVRLGVPPEITWFTLRRA